MSNLLIPNSESVLKNIFSLILLVSFVQGNAQSYRQYQEIIAEAFDKQDYYSALVYCESALQYGKDVDSLHYLAGEAALAINAYPKAELHFKMVANSNYSEAVPQVNYFIGEILYAQGKYGEAHQYFTKVIGQVEDPEFVQKAQERIKQLKWAKENQQLTNPLVKSSRVEYDGINTPENEFGPMSVNGQLYFVSMSKKYSNKKEFPKKDKGHIRVYDEHNLKLMAPSSVPVDSTIHTAHPAFTLDKKQFYFTKCEYEENSTKLRCEIYRKQKIASGWGPEAKLPVEVNAVGASNTQPFPVWDSTTQMTRLYFASDRKGGKGGFDIYSVLIKADGTSSVPENINWINTIFDEYSPFYNEKTRSLFFSSNGHPGYGGQDIFRYSTIGKDSLRIINLGASVNSSYDDLYFKSDGGEKKAFFSSNRPGSSYLDPDFKACCYDIYKMDVTPATIDLLAYTLDSYDSTGINGAKVIIYDITEDTQVFKISELPDKYIHRLPLIEGRKYKIVALKNNYLGDSVVVSTMDLPNFNPITKQLYLVEKKILNAHTFEKTTNIALKGVQVKVVDLMNNIVVSEKTSLDSNFFDFGILRGHNYSIIASKPKYESDTVKLLAADFARLAVIDKNLFLELTAIAELRKLLPIKLFFDNDIPNPKSELDTTSVLFSKIYRDYLDKKGRYMYEFADKLKEPAKSNAIFQIDSFFEQNVRKNAEKLNVFMDKLYIIMSEGHSIDIFLKGYASPRAKSEYNQHLSSRRVTSIRNEFDDYQQGIFHQFIKSENLKIKEIPFGESQASSDVSDSIEDVRNSIYNLKAAYERRVEILEILKGVDDREKL